MTEDFIIIIIIITLFLQSCWMLLWSSFFLSLFTIWLNRISRLEWTLYLYIKTFSTKVYFHRLLLWPAFCIPRFIEGFLENRGNLGQYFDVFLICTMFKNWNVNVCFEPCWKSGVITVNLCLDYESSLRLEMNVILWQILLSFLSSVQHTHLCFTPSDKPAGGDMSCDQRIKSHWTVVL